MQILQLPVNKNTTKGSTEYAENYSQRGCLCNRRQNIMRQQGHRDKFRYDRFKKGSEERFVYTL